MHQRRILDRVEGAHGEVGDAAADVLEEAAEAARILLLAQLLEVLEGELPLERVGEPRQRAVRHPGLELLEQRALELVAGGEPVGGVGPEGAHAQLLRGGDELGRARAQARRHARRARPGTTSAISGGSSGIAREPIRVASSCRPSEVVSATRGRRAEVARR